MVDIVVDTDVASKLIKRQEPEWVRRVLVGNRVWLTFVTVGELAKWAEIRSWGPQFRTRVDAWVLGKPVVPWNDSICATWGQIAGRAQLRGRPNPQNDTWIASCCIDLGIGLVTLNRRDFADLAEHEGLMLLGDELP